MSKIKQKTLRPLIDVMDLFVQHVAAKGKNTNQLSINLLKMFLSVYEERRLGRQPTVTSLSENLGVAPSSISRYLVQLASSLEGRDMGGVGLLEAFRDGATRREVYIYLTDEGEALARKMTNLI